MSILNHSCTLLRPRNFLVLFEDVHKCLRSRYRNTRASSRRGTRKRERKVVKLGRSNPRLVYDRSGRTSFPECPDRVSGSNRATDPTRNGGTSARPPARATASPLAWSPSREHRNAGRIALSLADRRSISYEYRCPWRYMTGDCVVFSQKYVPDTRIRWGLLLALGAIPKCRAPWEPN